MRGALVCGVRWCAGCVNGRVVNDRGGADEMIRLTKKVSSYKTLRRHGVYCNMEGNVFTNAAINIRRRGICSVILPCSELRGRWRARLGHVVFALIPCASSLADSMRICGEARSSRESEGAVCHEKIGGNLIDGLLLPKMNQARRGDKYGRVPLKNAWKVSEGAGGFSMS